MAVYTQPLLSSIAFFTGLVYTCPAISLPLGRSFPAVAVSALFSCASLHFDTHPVRHSSLLLVTMPHSSSSSLLPLSTCLLSLLPLLVPALGATNFQESFIVNWAPDNVRFLGTGQELQLVLTQVSGSGFASKNSYLFGHIDMQMKLIPGDSAGTVTAYYLSSETTNHDELDFEFLGNQTGEPYILQTNVFSNGVGGREQRIYLWFDPSAEFHTYSVSWTEQRIMFLVDEVPIRVFSNNEAVGVPYLSKQPLQVFSSIWNGDQWATQGGRIKINWANAPFVSSYRNFQATSSNRLTAADNALDTANLSKLAWVKKNFMVYDYCTDKSRYPTPPPECSRVV